MRAAWNRQQDLLYFFPENSVCEPNPLSVDCLTGGGHAGNFGAANLWADEQERADADDMEDYSDARVREVPLTAAPHLVPPDESGLAQPAVPALGEQARALSLLACVHDTYPSPQPTPNLVVSTSVGDSFRELGRQVSDRKEPAIPLGGWDMRDWTLDGSHHKALVLFYPTMPCTY